MHKKLKKTKNLYIVFLIFCIIFLLTPLGAIANSSSIKAISKTDKKKVAIGERFKYSLTVSAPRGYKILPPKEIEALGDFEIKNTNFNQKYHSSKDPLFLTYTLTTYKTGTRTILPVEIKYRTHDSGKINAIKSNKVDITVKSIFQTTKITDDVKKIKPPMPTDRKLKLYLKITLVFLIIFVLLVLIISFLKNFIARLEQVDTPAHIIAFRNLNKLLGPSKGKNVSLDDKCAQLSNILKEYLKGRFGINAPGMTERELSGAIGTQKDLTSSQKEFLEQFFKDCDLINFAKGTQEQKNINEYIKPVREFITHTRIIERQ